MDIAQDFAPLLMTVVVAFFVLAAVDHLLMKNPQLGQRHRLPRQLTMIALTLIALVAIVLSLPVEESLQGELLGLLGIVLTGIVAFSSTTFIANIMAGLMLRSVGSFSPGDFVEAGEHFGKVTELGLFHIEIQSEDRDLITLPNLFLAANPIKVVRSSGTVLSCTLSLGYDIPHLQVEKLCKEAALDAELEEPFVQIIELGNYAVTYKAAGFYRKVEHLLSRKSAFKKAILDRLHRDGIEIVSPTFMNQRQLDAHQIFVPPTRGSGDQESLSAEGIFPETLVFDKANQARRIEMLKEKHAQLVVELEQQKNAKLDESERTTLVGEIEARIQLAERLLEREQQQESQ